MYDAEARGNSSKSPYKVFLTVIELKPKLEYIDKDQTPQN